MNPPRRWVTVVRWGLVPFAAVLGIVCALVVRFVVGGPIIGLALALGHRPMGTADRIVFLLPFDGGTAAFFWVTLGALTAPAYRVRTAAVLLAVGLVVAWSQVGMFPVRYYAPGMPRYNHWPIIGTYAGGAAGLVLMYWRFGRRRPVPRIFP